MGINFLKASSEHFLQNTELTLNDEWTGSKLSGFTGSFSVLPNSAFIIFKSFKGIAYSLFPHLLFHFHFPEVHVDIKLFLTVECRSNNTAATCVQ